MLLSHVQGSLACRYKRGFLKYFDWTEVGDGDGDDDDDDRHIDRLKLYQRHTHRRSNGAGDRLIRLVGIASGEFIQRKEMGN